MSPGQKPLARLEYDHYEKKIVEARGVVIDGWTYHQFISPSNFKTIPDVEELYFAVSSGICKARKLSAGEQGARIKSNRERHALGESVYAPQKEKAPQALTGEKRRAADGSSDAMTNADP